MREQTTYQINPEILLFMRKSSGMSEDKIAKKLKLSRSKYLSIETGDEKISQNHLINLADIYKRPLIQTVIMWQLRGLTTLFTH